MMDNENAIEEKSFEFAVRIVNLSKYIRHKDKEYILTKTVAQMRNEHWRKCIGSAKSAKQSGFLFQNEYCAEGNQ